MAGILNSLMFPVSRLPVRLFPEAMQSKVSDEGSSGGIDSFWWIRRRNLHSRPGSRHLCELLDGLFLSFPDGTSAPGGVDHSINYHTVHFAEEIRALTTNWGVDLVLDAVGGDVLRRGYELLAPLGRLVSCGLSQQHPRSDEAG